MNSGFFNYLILGNTVKAYLIFLGIIVFCLLLKRLFSKLFSHFLLQLFGRFGKEVNATVFAGLLVKPIELLISLNLVYCAIQQLDYPLNEVLFKHTVTVDGKDALASVTIINAIDKIFMFLIIVSVFWIALRIMDFIAHVFAHRASLIESKEEAQLALFIKELVKIGTITIAFFVILGSVFNINVLPIITGLGIGGIAIALAAKESLENLLGSFTIFVDKPFVVGDFVKVNGIEGTVERVGFRSTRIRTAEKSVVTMPNKKMIDTPLENMTARNFRRVKFTIGLTYDTASNVIANIAQQITDYINASSHTNDDAVVTFDSFGPSSLDVQVLYYMEMTDYNRYLKLKEEINFKVIEIVQQHGAEFAFPTQTVIHQNENTATSGIQ